MEVVKLRVQEVTKIESHGASKVKGAGCGECNEHKLCKIRVEFREGAPLRLQGDSKVLGWY